MKDICCIGHITLDRVITPKKTVYMPGGTSYYFSKGINKLNKINYQLVTAIGPTEMHVIDDLKYEGIDIITLPSRKSVFFENKYGENSNERTQRVLAKADPFTIEGLKNINARIFHLGSLLADDFSIDVIKYLSTKGLVSVDVQGYLREVQGEKVVAVDWEDKLETLKYIHTLKVNEYEMEVLTGKNEVHAAAKQIADWGVKEVVVTTGSYGSLILAGGKYYEIEAYPPKELVDPTGCGDTYSTGYLYCRVQGLGYEESGRFAAAMSTIKLETSGPFNKDEDAIRKIMSGC